MAVVDCRQHDGSRIGLRDLAPHPALNLSVFNRTPRRARIRRPGTHHPDTRFGANRKVIMRKKIVAGAAALAIIGGGAFAATTAAAAGSGRGACVKANTAVVTFPRLDASGHCPAGSWGPVALGVGAQGPKGDKGDPGSSAIQVFHQKATVNADFQAGSVAQRTVVISGVPAFTVGHPELTGSNADAVAFPVGTPAVLANIAVAPVAPASGETTRKFVITPTGFTGSRSFELDVWVLVVVP